uniref:Uncharacterized protein n=1 Tax=Hordeum vulgare subsp. vulgare TaxID=112509 RepID=A0A8I6XCE2_HORVV
MATRRRHGGCVFTATACVSSSLLSWCNHSNSDKRKLACTGRNLPSLQFANLYRVALLICSHIGLGPVDDFDCCRKISTVDRDSHL